MCCVFCHFEFCKAGNYTRHLQKDHMVSATVSLAALDQPVEDHKETPHPYPNSMVPVRTLAWQKRRRSGSVMVEDIPGKSLK